MRFMGNLWKVTAPHVTELGKDVFHSCPNMVAAYFPSVTSIGAEAFMYCGHLTTIILPNATSIGLQAFRQCYKLRHIILHPNVVFEKGALVACLTLQVLAASTGFEYDLGDTHQVLRDMDPVGDPTVGLTHYLKWWCELDDSDLEEQFNTWHYMLTLSRLRYDTVWKVGFRAYPNNDNDNVAAFLLENEDISKHVLSFLSGGKDLRNATQARLLEEALELGELRVENNAWECMRPNFNCWGVEISADGKVIDDVMSQEEWMTKYFMEL